MLALGLVPGQPQRLAGACLGRASAEQWGRALLHRRLWSQGETRPWAQACTYGCSNDGEICTPHGVSHLDKFGSQEGSLLISVAWCLQ